MKILLIAYEFPPSPSPQSLRWAYLTRELARLGHDVHVVTPDLGPELGAPSPVAGANVTVHRTYAGPMRGFIAWHRRRKASNASADAHGPDGSTSAATASPQARRTSLKARVVNLAYRASERLWFPDVRGEWRPFARRALSRITAGTRFDVVISSHEPATCLELAFDVHRSQQVPWVADLGDPVLAPYTPGHWRARALQLESRTCRTATAITVTARSAMSLLAARHGTTCPIHVLTQGFCPTRIEPMPCGELLELAYVGRFYDFRRGDELFAAVAATPGVRLSVATIGLPASLRAVADANPDRFQLLGFLDHADALKLQAKAHVLVNIANRDASQVPGKLYEYLGAGRPILHISSRPDDPGALLIDELERGWVVDDERDVIASRLRGLRDGLATGEWKSGLNLSGERVSAYAWPAIGRQLDRLLHDVVRTRQVASSG